MMGWSHIFAFFDVVVGGVDVGLEFASGELFVAAGVPFAVHADEAELDGSGG